MALMMNSITKLTTSITTAIAAAPAYWYCSSWMMISSGAISDL